MDSITQQSLESMCNQCGSCCRPSVPIGDTGIRVVVKGLQCKYLVEDINTKKSTCSVYEKRKDVPWCLSLDKGFEYGAYAVDCPYTVLKSDYTIKKFNLSDEKYKEVEPYIYKYFLGKSQPIWVSDNSWFKFLLQMSSSEVKKSILNSPQSPDITEFEKILGIKHA